MLTARGPKFFLSSRDACPMSPDQTIIEPPYGVIWNRWQSGRVVPFLGAGASFVGRPAGAAWNARTPAFLPSGVDLARFLADESEFPSSDAHDRADLAKVSSYYVDIAGRALLRERLRSLLNHPYPSGPLHRLLAEIASPQVIVVTNYDTLVEQAFRAADKPYDLVIHPADRNDIANSVLWWPHGGSEPMAVAPNELDIDLATTTVIYKMHGTVTPETEAWDNYVITEEDYVDFLSRMTRQHRGARAVLSRFRSGLLFLGYGLRDWNLRVVLKNLTNTSRPAHRPRRRYDSRKSLVGSSSASGLKQSVERQDLSTRIGRFRRAESARRRRVTCRCALLPLLSLHRPAAVHRSGARVFLRPRAGTANHRREPLCGAADRPLRRERRRQELAAPCRSHSDAGRRRPHGGRVHFNRWQDVDWLTSLKRAWYREHRNQDSCVVGHPDDASRRPPTRSSLTFGGAILILLDQFEEDFLYHPESASSAFDAELASAWNIRGIEVGFALALRDDWLSRLDRFRGRVPNLLGNTLRLEHPIAAQPRTRFASRWRCTGSPGIHPSQSRTRSLLRYWTKSAPANCSSANPPGAVMPRVRPAHSVSRPRFCNS